MYLVTACPGNNKDQAKVNLHTRGKCYSVLRLFTGLAIAAFIACKLTVAKVMINAPVMVATKIHPEMGV